MPIGPRAWSFWVEFPISAPIPNSKPSVNRVEALTYTQAASTPSWNARADAVSRVTLADGFRPPDYELFGLEDGDLGLGLVGHSDLLGGLVFGTRPYRSLSCLADGADGA